MQNNLLYQNGNQCSLLRVFYAGQTDCRAECPLVWAQTALLHCLAHCHVTVPTGAGACGS